MNNSTLSGEMIAKSNTNGGGARRGFIVVDDRCLLEARRPKTSVRRVRGELRERRDSPGLPIIIPSSGKREVELEKALESGVKDCILKPFLKEEPMVGVRNHMTLEEYDEIRRENRRLKNEIIRMKRAERERRVTRRLLFEALDVVDHAVMAVNGRVEFFFYNSSFMNLFGYSEMDPPGKSFMDMIIPGAREYAMEFEEVLKKNGAGAGAFEKFEGICFRRKDDSMFFGDVRLHPHILEGERFLVAIIREHSEPSGLKTEQADPAHILESIDALNRNLERFAKFARYNKKYGDTIPCTQGRQADFKGCPAGGGARRDVGDSSSKHQNETGGKRRLVVDVMKTALAYWSEATGQSKIDLAVRSKIWNVYQTRDGYERTQTMDKYLDVEKLPKNPRWRKVAKTASYALSHGDATSSLGRRLEISLETLLALM